MFRGCEHWIDNTNQKVLVLLFLEVRGRRSPWSSPVDLVEHLPYGSHHVVGVLEVGSVPGIGDHFYGRPHQPGGHTHGDGPELGVLVARQQEDGHVDVRQVVPVGRLGARAGATEAGGQSGRIVSQSLGPGVGQSVGAEALLRRCERK